jgi:hypothetical protein
MKKIWIVIIGFLILILIIGTIFFIYLKPFDEKSISGPTINITYQNFAEVIGQNPLVIDLPADGSLLLIFYDKASSKREKTFFLTKGKVEEKDVVGDISLSLPSVYMHGLTNKNLCEKIIDAKNNNELEFSSSLSNKDLLWKYKGMMKYKSCLGISW